jgi:cytochrome c-type protein NapB
VKKSVIGLVLLLGLAAGWTAGPRAEEVKSLRGTDVERSEAAPGLYRVLEGHRLDRAFRQAPPLVPHTTDKYEVDLKVNQCLRCHEWPYSDQERAPKITDSHYVDADNVRRDQVSGTRYFCTQCHVPQSDARPLVTNLFKPAAPGR